MKDLIFRILEDSELKNYLEAILYCVHKYNILPDSICHRKSVKQKLLPRVKEEIALAMLDCRSEENIVTEYFIVAEKFKEQNLQNSLSFKLFDQLRRNNIKKNKGMDSIPKKLLDTKLSIEDEITDPVINKNYNLPKEDKIHDSIYGDCILPLKYSNFSKKEMLIISDLIHQINAITANEEKKYKGALAGILKYNVPK